MVKIQIVIQKKNGKKVFTFILIHPVLEAIENKIVIIIFEDSNIYCKVTNIIDLDIEAKIEELFSRKRKIKLLVVEIDYCNVLVDMRDTENFIGNPI